MGTVQRRRANTSKNKQYGRSRRTRHYTKDLDQIVLEDMQPEKTDKLLNQPL